MYSYIVAKIISTNQKSVTVEHNLMGYVIIVPRPEAFEKGKLSKIYLYKHLSLSNKNTINEDFYGFKNWEEKEFFMYCLAISGVGPKTAVGILKNDVSVLKQLISSKDQQALEQLPGVGKRNAYLLVEYLANTFAKDKVSNIDNIADVINVLKTLGYSQDDINFAINKLSEEPIDNSMETSDVVALAIKAISLKNEASVPKA